jgi:aspartyl-tRNA(Asn)/glutamyl-tRNA(Gln) amidotransferase subunit C
MALTDQDVNHVARLARLALTDEERRRYLDQLGRILEYVQKLQSFDVKDVPPTFHVAPLSNAWREDEARPWPDTEAILANSPDREDIYFKVKKVIE